MYEAQEDSFLLQKFVKRAKGFVLDMGTGSGIQAITAAQNKKVKKVIAVDIQKESVEYAKKHNPHKKIKYLQSELFSKLGRYKNLFDTIIFNAPYLPQENSRTDIELEGGKTGNEIIASFLEQAGEYLKSNGEILLVISSTTPPTGLFEKNLFVSEELGKQHYFFEDILVCELHKDSRAVELEKKEVKNLKYFAIGKRGIVFIGEYRDKKVAVKMKKESSQTDTIIHEAKILQEVNKFGIGPKYLFHTKNSLIYEFVEGKYLKEIIESKQINNICKKIFKQCRILDLSGINKQEMTRPIKHVIVKGNKITFIDFERARKAEETHNVTQFCQFVGNHIQTKQKEKWIKLAQQYAKNKNNKNFKKILNTL